MDRYAADFNFDKKNKITAVCWKDSKVISLITNFEDAICYTKSETKVKVCRKR